LLLLWQLNAAVAMPHAATSLQSAAAPAAHCTDHAAHGRATAPAEAPAPQSPDCCHDVSAGCHCAQLPALSVATLEFGDVAPAGPPPALPVTRHVDARTADFFRPPI
jgi:hypothetical protein